MRGKIKYNFISILFYFSNTITHLRREVQCKSFLSFIYEGIRGNADIFLYITNQFKTANQPKGAW